MGNPQLQAGNVRQRIAPLLPSAAEQLATRLATRFVVIVAGDASYTDGERVCAALDRAHERRAISLVVHGGATNAQGELVGVDRFADAWAQWRRVEVEPHPPARAIWGRAAESMRRRQMVRAGAHAVIAFPGARDVAALVRHAQRAALPVWRPFG